MTLKGMSQDKFIRYSILIDVTVDRKTTALTAEQHKLAVVRALEACVGDGVLTSHEPEAEIDVYSLT
jgi:hypothetical protein